MHCTVQEARPDSRADSARSPSPPAAHPVRGSGTRTGRARLQPQLSALLAEVRTVRRTTERAVQALADAGEGDYRTHLALLLDREIVQSSGRRQLIYLACAAEQGVLRLRHLELGRRTLMQIDALAEPGDHMALSALYWTTAQRWGRLLPGMAEPPADAHAAATAAGTGAPRALCPCDACRALQQDSRRFAPHATLEPASAYPRFNAPGSAAGFRCATCDTHWVRRMLPSEHFAVWSVMNEPAGRSLAGPTALRPR